MKPYRRKALNLAVKPQLQARLLGRLAILLLVCVTTGAAVFYLCGSHELGGSLRMAHLRIHSVQELLLPVLGWTAALALILGFGASLLFPNHVVGPLPRFEATLRRIGEGDLTGRLTLRGGDVLEELGAALNETSAGLGERVSLLKVQAEGLAERLQRLEAERPELKDLIGPASELCQRLRHDLEGFRTGD